MVKILKYNIMEIGLGHEIPIAISLCSTIENETSLGVCHI